MRAPRQTISSIMTGIALAQVFERIPSKKEGEDGDPITSIEDPPSPDFAAIEFGKKIPAYVGEAKPLTHSIQDPLGLGPTPTITEEFYEHDTFHPSNDWKLPSFLTNSKRVRRNKKAQRKRRRKN